MKSLVAALALTALALTTLLGCRSSSAVVDPAADPYVHPSTVDYLDGVPARNADGTVNVVVEIPAGTNDKWEVGEDGVLRWELENGTPRVVRYLGYPGNYGMIPRTLLPKELGGDGDSLDVILLGPSVARGSVVKARLVGVLAMLDGGEQDDKLLAVQDGTPLGAVRSLDELQSGFPGVTAIVETWFSNYKGPGKIECKGFADWDRADAVLSSAEAAFAQQR